MTHTWQSGSGCPPESLWRFAEVLLAAPHAGEVSREDEEHKKCGTVDHPCLADANRTHARCVVEMLSLMASLSVLSFVYKWETYASSRPRFLAFYPGPLYLFCRFPPVLCPALAVAFYGLKEDRTWADAISCTFGCCLGPSRHMYMHTTRSSKSQTTRKSRSTRVTVVVRGSTYYTTKYRQPHLTIAIAEGT
eukprot:scaffold71790_cov29-Tisochrysis_lutea.AAC.2